MATRCCWPPEKADGIIIAPLRQTDPVEPVFGDATRLRDRQPPDLGQAQHDVAQRRQMRKQVEALEHHAHARALPGELAPLQPQPPAAFAAIAHGLAVEPDLAGIELLQQVDTAQKRRLAGTAGADQRHHVGRMDIEIDPLQHLVRTERLGEAPDGEDRFHASS